MRQVNQEKAKMKNTLKLSSIVLLTVLFAGCAHLRDDIAPPSQNTVSKSALWIQNSAEYEASSLQVYNLATKNLQSAVKTATEGGEREENPSTLQPAVVLDIDETVLDNSRYFAKLVLENEEFDPATWDTWVALQQASAIPGALDFIKYAAGIGVEVVFITNRACQKREGAVDICPQKSDTISNLEKLGLTDVDPSNVLLKKEKKDWSSEKESRRSFVAKKYRIIMLIGDDLGDFLPNVKKNITPVERIRLVTEHADKWGKDWFILPNPQYGSWLSILNKPRGQYLQGY